MKKALLVFAGIALIASCKSFHPKSDLETMSLKGHVSKISEMQWSVVEKFGEIEKEDLQDSSIDSLNTDGNIINQYSSSSIDSTLYKSKKYYTYDDNGLMISYKGTSSDSSWTNDNHKTSKSNFSGTFKYNSDKFPIETDAFDEGKFVSKSKYEYDDNNLLKSEISYKSSGEIVDKNVYKRNASGLPGEIDSYGPTGNIEYVIKYKYDADNRVVENATDNKKFDIKGLTTYKYSRPDDHGNWLTRTSYDEKGAPISITERKIAYY